jgi:molybdopterin converting factor small subunit
MATLLLFAQAREAAGTNRLSLSGATVQDLLTQAVDAHPALDRVIPHCKIWVNGEPASPSDAVTDSDEVALLPPVSGG